MKKHIIILISALFTLNSLAAQSIEELMEQVPIPENVGQMCVKFNFASGSNVFNIDMNENRSSMDTICMVVNARIVENGTVLVDGYGQDDKKTSIRCNRIKSELISRIGMKEADFKTTKHLEKYKGEDDVVTVTIPSNVMASALRDFEIMRILSTPRIITVVEEAEPQQEVKAETRNEIIAAPQEQVFGHEATVKSSKPTLKYATRIQKQKVSKRQKPVKEPKQPKEAKTSKSNNDKAAATETVTPSKLKYATRIYPSGNKSKK